MRLYLMTLGMMGRGDGPADTAAREGVVLTVYGHDAEQWPTLRHAPEFYS